MFGMQNILKSMRAEIKKGIKTDSLQGGPDETSRFPGQLPAPLSVKN
jgi:hypothetical protein